jgi:hypothetical protein
LFGSEPLGLRDLPLCAKLPRGHTEAVPELLPEVILRLETAEVGDLADLELAVLEKTRCFLEPLFLEELTEEASRGTVESPGDVLTCEAQVVRNLLDGEFFVPVESAPHTLQQGADEIIHV